jgi:hypothetical protein
MHQAIVLTLHTWHLKTLAVVVVLLGVLIEICGTKDQMEHIKRSIIFMLVQLQSRMEYIITGFHLTKIKTFHLPW